MTRTSLRDAEGLGRPTSDGEYAVTGKLRTPCRAKSAATTATPFLGRVPADGIESNRATDSVCTQTQSVRTGATLRIWRSGGSAPIPRPSTVVESVARQNRCRRPRLGPEVAALKMARFAGGKYHGSA